MNTITSRYFSEWRIEWRQRCCRACQRACAACQRERGSLDAGSELM